MANFTVLEINRNANFTVIRIKYEKSDFTVLEINRNANFTVIRIIKIVFVCRTKSGFTNVTVNLELQKVELQTINLDSGKQQVLILKIVAF
jgi:hypothetical protein